MVCLTALTILPMFFGHADVPSGLITLICFLPMVFYFSEQSAKKKISQLEARIIELEETNKARPNNSYQPSFYQPHP